MNYKKLKIYIIYTLESRLGVSRDIPVPSINATFSVSSLRPNARILPFVSGYISSMQIVYFLIFYFFVIFILQIIFKIIHFLF